MVLRPPALINLGQRTVPCLLSDSSGNWPTLGQIFAAVVTVAVAVVVSAAVIAAAPAVAGVVAATASFYGASAAVAGALATATTVGCAAVAVGVTATGINRAVESLTGTNYGEKLLGEENYKAVETAINITASVITAVPQTVPYPSTGRSEPNNLNEQVAMNLTTSNPDKGKVIISSLGDPRMPGWLGWQKYQIHFPDAKITIHYVGNKYIPIYFDFKFK